MDKFVFKSKNKDPHLAVNISPADRAKKYPKGTFHADKKVMFCSSCNQIVDHIRKSVVDKHLESTTHKENEKKSVKHKQQTLQTAFECKTESDMEKVNEELNKHKLLINY